MKILVSLLALKRESCINQRVNFCMYVIVVLLVMLFILREGKALVSAPFWFQLHRNSGVYTRIPFSSYFPSYAGVLLSFSSARSSFCTHARRKREEEPQVDDKHWKKPRLFLSDDFRCDCIRLNQDSSHYLLKVMRMVEGDQLRVFDGENGEFLAEIVGIERRKLVNIRIISKIREMPEKLASPSVSLLFAPIKKAKLKSMLCTATELGISKLIPIMTMRTESRHETVENYRKNILESCEQCERLTLPELSESLDLTRLMKNYASSEQVLEYLGVDRLFICMERSSTSQPILSALQGWVPSVENLGIMVGPEGGFSEEEKDFLMSCTRSIVEDQGSSCTDTKIAVIKLGSNILRAETAGAFVLSCATAYNDDHISTRKPLH